MAECTAWTSMCDNSEAKNWPMCNFSKAPNSAEITQASTALFAVTAALIAL